MKRAAAGVQHADNESMAEGPGDNIIRVAGICGSLRPGSYTRMALNIALRGAAEVGGTATLIDLRDYGLPFCDGSNTDAPPGLLRLQHDVGAADGIILGTPEYHGSFSGVLKNALDLLGFDEFEGKMVGLVGVSGGAMGAADGLHALRNVGRALHAWVIPQQASIPEAWKVFDDAGNVKARELEDRLRDVGRQVTRFARLHKCEQAIDFLKQWETAPANPGA